MSWEIDPGWRDGPQGKEGTPPFWMVITKKPCEYGHTTRDALHLSVDWPPRALVLMLVMKSHHRSLEQIAQRVTESCGVIVDEEHVGSKLRALEREAREQAAGIAA